MDELGSIFALAADQPLPKEGKGRVILCDCEGTLFHVTKFKDGISVKAGLNLTLLDFLVEAIDRGYEVGLHSSDPIGLGGYITLHSNNPKLKKLLQYMDQKTEGEGILKKDVRASVDAFMSIDDAHGIQYYSQARNQLVPNDPRFQITLDKWRSGQAGNAAQPTTPNPSLPLKS